MKCVRSLLLPLMLVFTVIVLSGCYAKDIKWDNVPDRSESVALVGEWVQHSGDDFDIIRFNNDGSFVGYALYNGDYHYDKGSYEIDGDVVRVDAGDLYTFVRRFKISDGNWRLEMWNSDELIGGSTADEVYTRRSWE